MVPRVGLEPTRCHHHRILSPARLPIPPSRQGMHSITKFILNPSRALKLYVLSLIVMLAVFLYLRTTLSNVYK
jgi:hypothetical protein